MIIIIWLVLKITLFLYEREWACVSFHCVFFHRLFLSTLESSTLIWPPHSVAGTTVCVKSGRDKFSLWIFVSLGRFSYVCGEEIFLSNLFLWVSAFIFFVISFSVCRFVCVCLLEASFMLGQCLSEILSVYILNWFLSISLVIG